MVLVTMSKSQRAGENILWCNQLRNNVLEVKIKVLKTKISFKVKSLTVKINTTFKYHDSCIQTKERAEWDLNNVGNR